MNRMVLLRATAATGAIVAAIFVAGLASQGWIPIGRGPNGTHEVPLAGPLSAEGPWQPSLQRAGAQAGCELATEVPDDPHQPIPLADRFGYPVELPILNIGTPVGLTDLPGDLPVPQDAWVPLQLVLRTQFGEEVRPEDRGPIYQFLFAADAVRGDETTTEFLGRGGTHLSARPSRGWDAKKEVAIQVDEQDRDVAPPLVRVADYDAALLHVDPVLREDLRPWVLVWSDGRYDYELEADTDRANLVNLARMMYCT